MSVRAAAMFTLFAMASAGRASAAASSLSVPSRAVRECATCHPTQAKPHPATSMAHALELPAECAILKSHSLLTFNDGPYSYRIERKGDQSIYSVTDGQQTISAHIEWAFGLGGAQLLQGERTCQQLLKTCFARFLPILKSLLNAWIAINIDLVRSWQGRLAVVVQRARLS